MKRRVNSNANRQRLDLRLYIDTALTSLKDPNETTVESYVNNFHQLVKFHFENDKSFQEQMKFYTNSLCDWVRGWCRPSIGGRQSARLMRTGLKFDSGLLEVSVWLRNPNGNGCMKYPAVNDTRSPMSKFRCSHFGRLAALWRDKSVRDKNYQTTWLYPDTVSRFNPLWVPINGH